MKEVSEKYMKKIYLNILKAIVILAYFLVLNIICQKISTQHFERLIQLCTMIFLFITIFIFELAYKKDDDDLAIQGIEVLVLSTYTLTSLYITKKFRFEFKNYSLVASYIFAIYFVLKSIIIYTKGRKEIAEGYSDIKEIIKKEEPVKKEATKRKKKVETEILEKLDNVEINEKEKQSKKKNNKKKNKIHSKGKKKSNKSSQRRKK